MSKLIFKKIQDTNQVITDIATVLNDYLSRGTVLLLLSGGSAIPLEVKILAKISDKSNLSVSLNDERYGDVGHKDSNWQQLLDAGFDETAVKAVPVLRGDSFDATTQEFNNFLAAAQQNFDFLVSILGLGPDGHTSGILPNSPAASFSAWAVNYIAADYMRISSTFRSLKSADQTFIYAIGQAKHAQISRLSQDIAINEQPIQIVKQLRAVTFYNDYKGSE